MIFDSHAHYDDTAFDEDREALLASLPGKGVCGIVQASVNPASARKGLALAEQYSFIRVAVGVHPEDLNGAEDRWYAEIESLLSHPKVCAVGEIGLDYHYEDNADKETQKKWFARQLALANANNLPVIVHDRDAHEDTLALLKEYQPRGVVHCFSGSVEMMREIVDLGMYIGMGGVVTFKNARRPVEVIKAVPLSRLLLETDAPYLAPEPFRGTRCDSSLIIHTAETIAQYREMPVEELLAVCKENAERLFRRSNNEKTV